MRTLLLLAIAARTLLASDFFEKQVRPILAHNCLACHAKSALGGLSLTSGEAVRKGGNSGPAVIPGKPDESLLIKAVSHTHERLKMPPSGRLSDADIAVLRRWISEGAEWPAVAAKAASERSTFWAFQPVTRPLVPKVRKANWVKTPVDAFVLSRLEERGLQPAALAPKHVLLRRVYLDLIGIPPTPEEVDAFERNPSLPEVVDRLLASPHYGERWARHWLDVARYSDDKLNIVADEPYPNAFRYRDWVVKAFNDDMPYDLFVKAQLAADLMPEKDREPLLPGLGFYGMSAQYQEDRPDVTGKAFLGLTVGCAQCHDHKFDPIPTKDYYSWLGIFTSTRVKEYPLAPASVVADFQKQEKEIATLQKELDRFRQKQSRQLAEILMTRIHRYIPAAWRIPKEKVADVAKAEGLDEGTLQRWVDYLGRKDREGNYLQEWQKIDDFDAAKRFGEQFQATVTAVHREMREIEEKNLATIGGNPALSKIALLPYPRDKYVFWCELFGDSLTGVTNRKGARVLQYSGDDLDRFLEGPWRQYSDELKANLEQKRKALPAKYPFLHIVEDVEKPKDMRVHIRGNAENLGEEAPRKFLSVLSSVNPVPFRKGSGRLELAEAIANPRNPLTARVMVNRIWNLHFGAGIVRTPSNFGQLGDRPSHPELLDYLAVRFLENGWSIKAIHREIVLSATYALSTDAVEANLKVDPENRLLWRANTRRLDMEALRDSVLAVSGTLDSTVGGAPLPVNDEKNNRRTIYSFISRRKLDATLAVFDFPSANDTAEQRILTNTPIQRLYLLNSEFMMKQAERFAARVENPDPATAVRVAFRNAYGRAPSAREFTWAREFLESGEPMARLAQALMSSNEFLYVP